MILKKMLNIVLAFALTVGMITITGCGDESSGSVKIEYGRTMKVNSEGLPFPIEFDSHFLTDEETAAVVNYYYSISEKDENLAKQYSYPDYLEYLCENYKFDSIKDFLQSNYDTIGNVLGTHDYTFKSIEITQCFSENDKDVYTGFSDIDKVLSKASEEISGDDISSKIQSRKFVKANVICESDGNEISLTDKVGEDQIIYVYMIDGKPYAL